MVHNAELFVVAQECDAYVADQRMKADYQNIKTVKRKLRSNKRKLKSNFFIVSPESFLLHLLYAGNDRRGFAII